MILALIGFGKWGRNYLRAVKKIRGAEIRYVCSGGRSLANLPGEYIKIYNYKDLVRKKDIEGIIVAVPSSKHYELASFFLEANKPILVEKPMVTSLNQAKKLKTILEQTRGKILVGNIFLYNPAFQKFTKLLTEAGGIRYLNLEGCDYGPIRNDVSCLWDWGPHDVSMVLEILKKPPISVSAWAVNALRPNTNLYDMVYARLIFENNIQAFLRIGWLSPIKERKVILVGEKGSLIFDDTKEKKLFLKSSKDPKKLVTPDYSYEEPLVEELKDFVACIKGKREPRSDFKKNFIVTEILDGIEQSICRNGMEIKI